MKNTKRRIEQFSFYNLNGINAHLTKMAEKGWMLDRITNPFWIYRRIEPKHISFAVSYFSKASEFDPEPTEPQQRFIDFCAHTGWEFACASAQLQVFYNERQNPTPIETEPMLELEALHNVAKKSFIPSYAILLFLGLLMGGLWLSNFIGDPIDLLSSPADLSTGLCWLILFLLTVVELTSYFRWRRKAKAAASQGDFLSPLDTSKFQKILLMPAAIGFGYWMLNWLLCGDALKRWLVVVMCIYLPTLFAVTNGVKTVLKRKKASRGANRTLTVLASFVCAFAIMGGITAATLHASSGGFFKDTMKAERLPLTVGDLLPVDNRDYRMMNSMDESLLLSRQEVSCYPDFDSLKPGDAPISMEYTVIGVKLPVLYDWCENRMIYEQETLYHVHQSGVDYQYRAEDASVWNARKVYRLYDNAVGFFTNRYLLCYDNALVEMRFDWEPTQVQKALIGTRFGK